MFNMQTTVSDDGEGNVKLNFDKLQVVCLEYQWSDDNEFRKGLLCSYSLYLSLHSCWQNTPWAVPFKSADLWFHQNLNFYSNLLQILEGLCKFQQYIDYSI